MSKKNLLYGIIVAVVVVCVVVAVIVGERNSGEQQAGGDKDVIKIGAILPLTGNLSSLGNSVAAGLKIAVEEINEASPMKFDVIIEDNNSDIKNTMSAYRKIKIQNDIKYVVTTSTAFSMALKPVAIEDDVLLFCIASFPDLTKESKHNIFRIGNTSVEEALTLVDHIKNKNVATKTWIFYPNSEYGIPFDTTIKENLAGIEGSTVYNEQDQDYKNTVLPATKSEAKNIIAIGFSSALGRLIKSIREQSHAKSISSNLGFYNENVLSSAGTAKNGVWYVDYQIHSSEKTYERAKIAQERYGVVFSSTCFLAYIIPYLVQQGQLNKTSNMEDVSKQIKKKTDILINNEYKFLIKSQGDVLPLLEMREYRD
jgi:branched-chain amino acid transport system substrate-binding protein